MEYATETLPVNRREEMKKLLEEEIPVRGKRKRLKKN